MRNEILDDWPSGRLPKKASPDFSAPTRKVPPLPDSPLNNTPVLGTIASGTYTPTLTNVANLDASTVYSCQYIRIGNVVTVSGQVDVDPTLAATSTKLGISLPISSVLANSNECAGSSCASAIAGQSAAILGDVANARAQMQWISGDITNQPMYFTFTYRII